MRKSLYVGNLARETTADDLAEAFGRYGTVARAQVVTERDTGQSRGFGFVEMTDGSEKAIANLNGAQLQGRTLTVNAAKPRDDRGRPGGSGRRGRY
jgi:RNA recognition motif-containing protein